MFGFRPEPIAIPVVATSSSLDLPLSGDGFTNCGGSCTSGAPSVCGSSASTTIIEPLDQAEQAIFGGSEIQPADLQVLHNVGHGSSGIVQKVLHTPSDSVLALKIIPVEAGEAKRKQILLELKTLHESMHPSIVSFYGAFFREGAVHVALEYMDASLLDIARSEGGALPEPVLAGIARPVLQGLVYMHRERHMIHRDIKPANVLVDVNGNVKLADFGVSGELGHTLAKCASWVGTVHYMSPERIQGSSYSYDSDVWSLGITILELAMGSFPYPPERGGRRLSFWDLLDAIVESPPPTPPAHFSPPFHAFVTACLHKEPGARASSSQLLSHPALSSAESAIDTGGWIREAIDRLPPRSEGGDGGASADETASAASAAFFAGLDGGMSLSSTIPRAAHSSEDVQMGDMYMGDASDAMAHGNPPRR